MTMMHIYCCHATCKNGQQCPNISKIQYENKRYCRMHYNNIITQQEICSICLETIASKSKIKTTCCHLFHTKCLTEWVRQDKDTCPNCRISLDVDLLVRLNRDVIEYIGNCIYSLPQHTRKQMLGHICQALVHAMNIVNEQNM